MLTDACKGFALFYFYLVNDFRELEVLKAKAEHKLGPDVEGIEEDQQTQCSWEELLEILTYQGNRVQTSQHAMECGTLNIYEFQEIEAQWRGKLG